jgi:hypothetical protein
MQIFLLSGLRRYLLPSHNLTNSFFQLSNLNQLTWLTIKLLLALASTAILGSEAHGTHDHILLSEGSGILQTTLSTNQRS